MRGPPRPPVATYCCLQSCPFLSSTLPSSGGRRVAGRSSSARVWSLSDSGSIGPASAGSSRPGPRAARAPRARIGSLEDFVQKLKLASDSREPQRVTMLLTDMVEAGVAPDARALAVASSALVKGGDVSGALTLMNKMVSLGMAPLPSLRRKILSSCTRAGKWKEALAVLRGMDERDRGKIDYSNAITAARNAREMDVCMNLLEEMRHLGIPRDVKVYGSVMAGFARVGKIKVALRLLEEMREEGIRPDAYIYSSLLSSLRADAPCNIAELLEAMHSDGVEPNSFTYSSAMMACARLGDYGAAQTLLRDMKDRGQFPDLIAYNSALAAAERGGMGDVALDLLEAMASDGVSPDVISYSSAMGACADAHNWRKAIKLLQVMEEAGISANVRSYTAAVRACVGAGEWEDAFGIIEKMKTRGVLPDATLYGAVLRVCADGGQWERALELLDAMRSEGLRPNVVHFTSAIAACDRGGAWDMALMLLDQMRALKDAPPNVITYTATMSACVSAGQWVKALSLLKDMRSEGILPNEVTYGTLLAALGDAHSEEVVGGNSSPGEIALGLLTDMEEQGMVPSERSVAAALSACAREGDVDLVERALVCISELNQETAYNAAIHAAAGEGHVSVALLLLEDMKAKGIADAIGYSSAIVAADMAGEWEVSLRLLKEMQEPDVVCFNCAIQAVGRSGMWDVALDLRRSMSALNLQPDAITYSSLMTACANAAQVPPVLELLDEMRASGLVPNVVCYNACLSACDRAGDAKEAKRLLKTMKSEGVAPDTISYAAAMSALEGEEDWNGVLKLSKAMMSSVGYTQRSVRTVTIALNACARVGSWALAHQLLEELRDGLNVKPSILSYNAALEACSGAAGDDSGAATGAGSATLSILDMMEADGIRPDVVSLTNAVISCGAGGQWTSVLSLYEDLRLLLASSGGRPSRAVQRAALAACAQGRRCDTARLILDTMRSASFEITDQDERLAKVACRPPRQ